MLLLDAKLTELGSPGLKTRAKALAQQDLDMGISFMAHTQGERPPSEHRLGWETAGRHRAHGMVARAHALGGVPRACRRTQGPRSLLLGILHLW